VLTIALLAAFVAELRLQWGGASVTRWIDDVGQLLAAGAMAVAGLGRARRARDRLRVSWLLVASGGASWCIGQCVWSYYELIGATQTPFPSAADAGYLLFPLLAMVGLLFRPSQAFTGRGRVRVALDIALVLASLLTISWTTALGGVYHGDSGGALARVVSLAYPLGDVALLTVVVSVVAFARAGGRLGLLCLGGGLAAFAFADSGFALLTASGSYKTGNLIDAGWVAGFAILGWAAVLDRSAERHAKPRASHRAQILPYLPSLTALGLATWRLGPSSPDGLLLISSTVMVIALIARQAVVVGENSRLAQSMRHQAFHDTLTGLANRALFQDRLEHALRRHARDREPMALLLIDLDNFKLINDSLGHPAGDELLVKVSRRLSSAVRASDTVARLGGDEFAILIEASHDAEVVARRILAGFGEPVAIGTRHVVAGASVGIAPLTERDLETTASELLQHADIAMYAAKRAGRGVSRVYQPDMALLTKDELDLQAALLADITTGHLDVVYQPIYLGDGRPLAIEALARWTYRGREIAPDTFLRTAREIDCIAELDMAVLTKAVSVAARLDGPSLAVNLDLRTLADPSLARRVAAVLEQAGLPARRLAVEVPEFDLVERDATAVESLYALRHHGAAIVVDDFGAGYATLARLRALRPDILKIDRSLVAGIQDGAGEKLLAAAAQLGRHIGASVVAEGIETRSQLRAAVDAGCDAFQGFLLSRPVHEHDLAKVVDRGPLRALAT
jgi:diguanylate cyclase (GGDEF)-like protein